MSVQPNVTQKIVVSIDFGTSRSGYAYNITGKQTFVANNWPLNYPKQYCKTWTQTLYKLPKGAGKASPVAFGGEAIQQLAEMDEEEAKGYELVKFFKMKLHNNPSGLYVGSSGYEFQAIDLVVDYLSFMHEQVMTELSSNIGSSPSPDEILWCLTIPAIWKEEEKAIMKQAAFKAGIISSEIPTEEEFLLILEPEGAAAYCLEIMSHQGTAMNEDDTFLILDCGGGTVDLTSHKISNGRLSELTTGSGGACGSSVLDANFWKILESISSEEVINNFKRECPKGVAQISSAWEQAKSTVKNLKTLTFVELAYDSLALVDVLGQQCPIFASRGGSKHIKLVISNITAIFEPVLKDIITLVNDQFNAVIEAQGKPFDYLFIVGGMGGSPLLIDVIKREFGSKINRSIQSVFVPGEAVVKGATLLGLDPSLIIARKMRQTYGMEATVEFKDGEHDVTKRVELLDKSGYYCKHYFDKFVEIKQTVDNVHAVARTYKVQSARQKSMALSMYTTLDPNPLYIDQRGVSKLGKLIIDMSDLTGGIDRSVTVKTYFGKSDIKIEAVQSNNPTQRYNATFKFDTSLIEYNGVEEEEIKYHIIFANDISGSMHSSDAQPSLSWLKINHNNRVGALYESCLTFLQQRAATSTGDLVSCIVYNCSATHVFRAQPLQEDLIKNNLLGYKAGGNTNYLDAMRKIGEILADNPPNYTPVVLFMTDGQMSDDGATSILNGLMEAYHDTSGLTLHTIVVGTQGEENIMQQLAQVGKGKMHRSGMSLTELKQVYASLAGVLEQN